MNLLQQIGIAVVLVVAAFFGGRWQGVHSVVQKDAVAVMQDTVKNVKEITHAEDVKGETVRTIVKYVHDKPLGPVSLCVSPSSVDPLASATDSSIAGGLAAEVHDGDSGVRAEEAGPDISGLLGAYAAVFAIENANLTEQQAVK